MIRNPYSLAGCWLKIDGKVSNRHSSSKIPWWQCYHSIEGISGMFPLCGAGSQEPNRSPGLRQLQGIDDYLNRRPDNWKIIIISCRTRTNHLMWTTTGSW